MGRKAVNKVVEKAELAEVKHEHKHEDIKQFLKRKIKTFAKFKQTSVLKLRRCYDPVRCTTCGKIVFYVADISYDDEFTGKAFEVKNVCDDCLSECKVQFMSIGEMQTFIRENQVMIQQSSLKGEQYTDVCDICLVKTVITPIWVYKDGMPLKVTVCDKDFCFPENEVLYSITPAGIKTLDAVPKESKVSLSELDQALKEIK